jgi:hypothetical protein
MKLFKAMNQNIGKTEIEIKLKKGRVNALFIKKPDGDQDNSKQT